MSVKPIGTATESEIWQCMSEAYHRAGSWKASRVPPHAVSKKFSRSWIHCLSLDASIPIRFNPGYRHRRFKYLFSLQRCHLSMRIPFTSAHFFPLFLIPWDPVFSGPLVPFVLAARSAFAFASALCFSRNALSSSSISPLGAFFGAFRGFALPPALSAPPMIV